MRITVVSDIHGNIAALRRVADTAENLVVLGDLLDYVDYHDHGAGILGTVFGADRVATFAALRAAGEFRRLHEYNGALWDTLADPLGTITAFVADRYAEVLDAVGPDALLTLGNVDVAQVWNDVAASVLPYRDAEVVTLGAHRLGFVAGGARRPGAQPVSDAQVWRPMMRSAVDYRAAVAAIGPVDVLCSHVPPQIPQLRYDTVPGRLEMFGPGLLEAIDAHAPAFAVFGHVHQPLAARARRGRTECLNAGHFQRTERGLVIDLDRARSHAAARQDREPGDR